MNMLLLISCIVLICLLYILVVQHVFLTEERKIINKKLKELETLVYKYNNLPDSVKPQVRRIGRLGRFYEIDLKCKLDQLRCKERLELLEKGYDNKDFI